MPNRYQIKEKAKLIAAVLLPGRRPIPDTYMSQLALLASRMTDRQWITVSLQAGVPMVDETAKNYHWWHFARLASAVS